MNELALDIEVAAAGLAVQGLLLRPRRSRALLVFGHGAGAGIRHPLLAAMAAALAAERIATLRFHFPFMQKQIDARGGDRGFGRDPLPVAMATIEAAVSTARRRRLRAPLLVGGHSYGARMASHAAAAQRLADVSGLLLLSFPLHAPKRPARTKAEHFGKIRMPTLCLAGERDAMATAPMFEEVVAELPQGTLVRVPGADHGWQTLKRFQGEAPLPVAARAAASWIDAL